MARLAKHRTILGFQPNVSQGYEGPTVKFSREPDDDSDTPEAFLMEVGGWAEMGNPDKITVTIEPGDLLNL